MELSEELRKVVRSVLMEKKQSDQNESSGWLPWSARILKIPFRSSEKTGSGPGEDRLAAEWGGQTMGQSTSYDVVVNGQKWEVKAPVNNEVRIEKEGVKAIQPALKALNKTILHIKKLFGMTADPDFNSQLIRIFSEQQLENFQEFITTDGPEFARGEISVSRAQRLHQVLLSITESMKNYHSYQKKNSKTMGSRYVSLGVAATEQKRHDVDINTIVRVAKLLKMSPSQIMSELNVSLEDVVSAMLVGKAFKDPDAFMEQNWINAVRPSEIFGEVEGVVLVSETGYRVIRRSNLDDVLYFKRVSKGQPFLAVKK